MAIQVTLAELKEIVREEYMRGVPEWALRQATSEYVERVRQHVVRFILANKSNDIHAQQEAIALANETLEELEKKANDLLEDQLWRFLRQV